ncbi:Crp/Fnr family transcriptional regulator [Tropicibacter sp. R16_0]|nr:Crp/Fnr family transcriptional regulator [Tropicibacter sp. R16_0]
MPEEAVEILRASGVRRTYSANQMVVNIGDEFPELFVVEKGRFSISIIDDLGNAWIYGYLGPGSTWGLKAVLTERPAGFVFEAIEDSAAVCIDRTTLWSLIDNDAVVRRGVILSLGWSVTKATEFAHKERTLPLRVRLRSFLLEHADDDGVLKLTQTDMARILGVSRYALGSQLQKLKQSSLIDIRYGQVRITDYDGLRQNTVSK